MTADQPGIRRVPPDLYEWNARKRHRNELLAMLLICALFTTFVAVCLTLGASVR